MLSKHAATLALLLSSAAYSLNACEPEPGDTAKVHGVWVAEKVLFAGREVPPEKFPFELHFDKTKLIFKFVGQTRSKDRVHEIVLDSSRSPATIDITREIEGQRATVRGIYKFDNDRLVICSLRDRKGQPSDQRPKTFESSPAVTSDLLVLKRKSAADQ